MTTANWQTGVSGDWSTGTDWSTGVPSATTTANIAGQGNFVVTLLGAGSAAALTLNAPGGEFYDSGALTLTGALALQAGTLALAYGAIDGGTIEMLGGTFLSTGGVLSGDTVDGVLGLTTAEASVVVQNGLSLTGAGGSGSGSIALTGAYAALDYIGSQALRNTVVSIGASGSQPGQTGAATLQIAHAAGASAGATLTLGGAVWIRDSGGQAQIVAGSLSPGLGPALPDELLNGGTITAASSAATLGIAGSGTLVNQGTIAASNGALLEISTEALVNTGTITVNNATLELGGTFSAFLLSGLGNITLSNGEVVIEGDALLGGGTLSLGTGSSITGSLGAVGFAGTLQGGTVADEGGGFDFTDGTGTFSAVTYQGTLSLAASGAALTLTNGAEVTGGGIAVTGSGAQLLLLGTETLNNASIALGAAGQTAAIGTADAWLSSTATTATLGPQISLQQAGQYAALQANGFSPVAGLGLSDTLVNQGSIAAAVSGGTLAISGYGTFFNQGSITVSGGDTLLVTVQDFANTGTLTVGSGGTATLGGTGFQFGQAPAWSNAGQIAVNGGALLLEGYVTISQLGSVSENGGVVTLAGTLNNAGSTLALGAGSGLADVGLTGTITGGTIADSSSALTIGSAGTALLQGTTYQGTLALTSVGADLNVRGGLSVTGGKVSLTGAGAVLDFIGTQTFDATRVAIGAAGTAASIEVGHDYGRAGGSTLTLGANLAIFQSSTLAAIGTAAEAAGDAIVNAGTITASVAGGTLTLGGATFINQGRINVGTGDTLAIAAAHFSNTGSIAVCGGSLSVGGSLTLAGLGQVSLGGGTFAETGTLNLAGGTLAIGQGSAIGQVALTGTIANGSIADGGGGLLDTGGADLSGITYLGLLDLSRPFADLGFSNGLTVTGAGGSGTGSIQITGAESRLVALNSETLNQVAITLGSPLAVYGGQTLTVPELAAGAGAVLTIGSGTSITLVGQGGNLGDSALGQWTDSVVNDGSILTALSATRSPSAAPISSMPAPSPRSRAAFCISTTPPSPTPARSRSAPDRWCRPRCSIISRRRNPASRR